jgi:hypothetical protein
MTSATRTLLTRVHPDQDVQEPGPAAAGRLGEGPGAAS